MRQLGLIMLEVTIIKRSNDNLSVMKKMIRCLKRKFKKEKTNAIWFELSQYKKNY